MAALAGTGACSAPGTRGAAAAGPPVTFQGKLLEDTAWHGTVILADDFQVPRGRTLRIAAGTRVLVRQAETTKTEPEYLDNATELLVRGRLLVEGTAARPVVFERLVGESAGESELRWGGILFDGGSGAIRHARLDGADTGLTLLGSSPTLLDLGISNVRNGIAVHRGSAPQLTRVSIQAEEGGISCWSGSAPTFEHVTAVAGEHEGLLVAPAAAPRVTASTFTGRLTDVLWGAAGDPPPGIGGLRIRRVPVTTGASAGADGTRAAPAGAIATGIPPGRETGRGPEADIQGTSLPPLPFVPQVPSPGSAPTRIYRGEQFVGEDTTWEGEVVIDGTVMVAPVAQLTIAPGTVVRFVFRDTDGDGVGESELFIQGRLLAEGSAAAPIVFTAFAGGGPGRWGAINLMGTDAAESRLAWCLVESSFRGLHSHFSRFRVENSIFRGNFRSLQFQESTAVITGCVVIGSTSALRFRDSTAALEGLAILGNTLGVQILRSSFSLTASAIAGNALAGVHVRESEGTITGCRIEANAPGVRASDCRLRLEGNRFSANNGAGLQLRRTEGRVENNRIEASIGNGISTDSPGAVLRGNSLVGSLRFALESNTVGTVDAVGNWWGPEGLSGDVIFDAEDDPGLGPVQTFPPLATAPAGL